MGHAISTLVFVSLLLPGAIHLLPVYGVLGNKQLEALYGLKFNDPNLLIVMRHRAVMFGLLGGLLTYSAFTPSYRNLAFCSGLISAASFLCISETTGGYNSKVRGVVVADAVAVGCLVVGACLHWSYSY
jgi:hypothetical protein